LVIFVLVVFVFLFFAWQEGLSSEFKSGIRDFFGGSSNEVELRQSISDNYYDEASLICVVPNAEWDFDFSVACKEAVRCVGDFVAENVKKGDLGELAKYMEESGFETGIEWYSRMHPEFEEIIGEELRGACPGFFGNSPDDNPPVS